MTFESALYDTAYFARLHPRRWFTNPPRKYAERNRDILRLVAPEPDETVLDLGTARGDVAFLLARHARDVIGVDAAPEALRLAEEERLRRGVDNIRWVCSDVADLGCLAAGSVSSIAAVDLVEHIDDSTLRAMLQECRRLLAPGGRLGIYTPDRAHYVERLKAHNLILRQFPQHIAVRRRGAYETALRETGFCVEWSSYSVSPFPGVRWLERVLAPLPFIGASFRYRILLRARPAP